MDERRRAPRTPAEIPVSVEAGGQSWRGTVINYSPEGALLKLVGLWQGDRDLVVNLDPDRTWDGFTTEGRLVRAHSVDGITTELAVRFS